MFHARYLVISMNETSLVAARKNHLHEELEFEEQAHLL